MLLCEACGLTFAHPMTVSEPPEKLFGEAYGNLLKGTQVEDFADRLRLRPFLLRTLEHAPPSVCYKLALEHLEAHVARGSTVFEIGVGTGAFLHLLRRRGYNAVGLDVAEPVVRLLKQEGFRVWHGTLQTLPESFVEPAFVCSFFVLHHLSDPIDFVQSIRRRFPSSPVVLAVADGKTIRRIHGGAIRHGRAKSKFHALPPRTPSWWTGKSVETLLTRAGYKAEVFIVTEQPINVLPLQLSRRLAPVLNLPPVSFLYTLLFPAFQKLLGSLEKAFRLVSPKSFPSYHDILAVGIPDND